MGTLTDSLLKLTEFPFSYSLFSVIFSIYTGGALLSQPLGVVGPVLFFAGFFATALTIADPVGAAQKFWLRGRRPNIEFYFDIGHEFDENRLRSMRVFDMPGEVIFSNDAISASLSYRFLKSSYTGEKQDESLFRDPIKKMDDSERRELFIRVLSLRESTLRTTWISREIEKVTGLIYSVIVILALIAYLFVSSFTDTLVIPYNMTVGENATFHTNVSNQTLGPNQTITITSITPGSGASLEIKIVVSVLSIILVFSILHNVRERLKDIRSSVDIVFNYLLTRQAYILSRLQIGVENETFDKSLQEIEQYLANGDWTLARILVETIRDDYDKLFFEKLKPDANNKLENKNYYRDLGIY